MGSVQRWVTKKARELDWDDTEHVIERHDGRGGVWADSITHIAQPQRVIVAGHGDELSLSPEDYVRVMGGA